MRPLFIYLFSLQHSLIHYFFHSGYFCGQQYFLAYNINIFFFFFRYPSNGRHDARNERIIQTKLPRAPLAASGAICQARVSRPIPAEYPAILIRSSRPGFTPFSDAADEAAASSVEGSQGERKEEGGRRREYAYVSE